MKGQNNDEVSQTADTFYALGYFRRFLEDYSRSSSLSAEQLGSRLGTLLLAQTSGEVLGTIVDLPTLRRSSAKGSKTPRSLEVAGSPHRKTSLKIPGGVWTPARRRAASLNMKRNQAMLQKRRKQALQQAA